MLKATGHGTLPTKEKETASKYTLLAVAGGKSLPGMELTSTISTTRKSSLSEVEKIMKVLLFQLRRTLRPSIKSGKLYMLIQLRKTRSPNTTDSSAVNLSTLSLDNQ
jgi:hypothetical protein